MNLSARNDYEAWAAELEASGDYRVLRRLQPRQPIADIETSDARQALYVDVETTGLDTRHDEIIELAMIPFWYGAAGEILGVGEPFQSFNEPSRSISAEVQALTGITDAMVAGHRIDEQRVTHLAQSAVLIVAHNAAFDRRFMERLAVIFSTKAWACSMSQVDWAGAGHEGVKLPYLAQGCGFFYDRHRALNDCFAAIELLARPLWPQGRSAMADLLQKARTPSWRVWAENSPFELKDQLKARGYRWNADTIGSPRAWYIDVEESALEAEITYLRSEIYQREIDLLTRRIDAHDRFSDRC